jgi:hypothetical protein
MVVGDKAARYSHRMGATKSRVFACAILIIGSVITRSASLGIAAAPNSRGDSSVTVVSGADFAAARQPQVAVGGHGAVYVTFGLGNAIYCARATDGGDSFTPPYKHSDSGVPALGKRRGPRIAVTGDAVTVTAVVGKRGDGKDGHLLTWAGQTAADRGRARRR